MVIVGMFGVVEVDLNSEGIASYLFDEGPSDMVQLTTRYAIQCPLSGVKAAS